MRHENCRSERLDTFLHCVHSPRGHTAGGDVFYNIIFFCYVINIGLVGAAGIISAGLLLLYFWCHKRAVTINVSYGSKGSHQKLQMDYEKELEC